MVFAVHLSDTITLGSVIIATLLGMGALAVFGYGVRWKSASDVANSELGIWKDRAERLQGEQTDALAMIANQKETIGMLERKPDYESIEKLVNRIDQAATDRTVSAVEQIERLLENHEKRAEARHDLQMKVLKRLLPEVA